jgi:hypothetical protein
MPLWHRRLEGEAEQMPKEYLLGHPSKRAMKRIRMTVSHVKLAKARSWCACHDICIPCGGTPCSFESIQVS